MGSMITLGIGNMEIDWGKNSSYTDHSALFKLSDIKLIPYYYVDIGSDEIITVMKEGYSRKLSNVEKRLDMLGYSISRLKEMYEELVKEYERDGYRIKLSYETFFDTVKTMDISLVNTVKYAVKYEENGYDLGEYVQKCIFELSEIRDKMLVEYNEDEDYINLKYDLSIFLENIDPYITLRILAENPNNLDCEL